jgi:hypothetical protein
MSLSAKRLGSIREVEPAKQRAGSQDYDDVQSAADGLMEKLPGENGQ